MLGFKLAARGVIPEDLESGAPFHTTIERWSEGDLTFLKFASMVSNSGRLVESPANFASTFTPEKIFSNIKQSKLLQICDLRWDCMLWVNGDMQFSFHFLPKKSGMQNMQNFLDKVKAQSTKMRDQVMIALCDALSGFSTHCLMRKALSEKVGLNVELDL